MASSPPCRVCGGYSNGAYLGVDSCRACAMFFYRWNRSGRVGKCKQGRGNCVLSRGYTHSCRRCRYEKCVAVGMQTRYEEIAVKDIAHDHGALDSTTPGSSNPCNSTAKGSNYELLRRVAEKHARSVIDRRLMEQSMNSLENAATSNPFKAEFRPADDSVLGTMLVTVSPIIAEFCNKSFTEFEELRIEDKVTIFEDFMPRLINLEAIFKQISSNIERPYKTRLCTGYFDIYSSEGYLTDRLNENMRRGIEMINEKAIGPQSTRLIGTVRRLNLDEIERAALFSLLLWSPLLREISGEAEETSSTVQKRIFKNLGYYYRQVLGQENYAARVGELMMLVYDTQENMRLSV